MPLKESERVIYKKTPLIRVTCRIPFPLKWSINENVPVDFKKQIRGQYPLYNVAVKQQQIFVPRDTIVPFPDLGDEWTNNYTFSSNDKAWMIALTGASLALTTSAYKRWEEFLERLRVALEALKQIYKPTFFERVELRYINAICRSQLSLDASTPWKDLIKPFTLGILLDDDFTPEEILGYTSTAHVNIGNGALAIITTSTGFLESEARKPKPEISFIIDNHLYFDVKKRPNEIYEALTYLNQCAGKLIQSIITEKLHNAMEPEKI